MAFRVDARIRNLVEPSGRPMDQGILKRVLERYSWEAIALLGDGPLHQGLRKREIDNLKIGAFFEKSGLLKCTEIPQEEPTFEFTETFLDEFANELRQTLNTTKQL